MHVLLYEENLGLLQYTSTTDMSYACLTPSLCKLAWLGNSVFFLYIITKSRLNSQKLTILQVWDTWG